MRLLYYLRVQLQGKMDRFLRVTFISIGLLLASVLPSLAQDVLRGRVVDSDGVAVPNASVSYKGRYIAVSADGQGRFSIERHNGWEVERGGL